MPNIDSPSGLMISNRANGSGRSFGAHFASSPIVRATAPFSRRSSCTINRFWSTTERAGPSGKPVVAATKHASEVADSPVIAAAWPRRLASAGSWASAPAAKAASTSVRASPASRSRRWLRRSRNFRWVRSFKSSGSGEAKNRSCQAASSGRTRCRSASVFNRSISPRWRSPAAEAGGRPESSADEWFIGRLQEESVSAVSLTAAIERCNLGGEMLLDHSAAQRELRGHLPRVDGEAARQQRELPDLLKRGDILEPLADAPLEHRQHLRVLQQLLTRRRLDSQVIDLDLKHIVVGHDQRGEARAIVPHDQGLENQRVLRQ